MAIVRQPDYAGNAQGAGEIMNATVMGITLGMIVAFGFITVVGSILAWRYSVRLVRYLRNVRVIVFRLPRFVEVDEVDEVSMERVNAG
jgi:hypothetical protein